MNFFFNVFLFFVLLTSNSFAQINKGNFLTGGLLGGRFSQSKSIGSPIFSTQETTERELNFIGQIGYFLVNKFALGINAQYSLTQETTVINLYFPSHLSQRYELNNKIFAIGPFARYYLLSPKNKFNVYFQGAVLAGNILRNNFSYIDPAMPIDEESKNLMAYQISAAPSYFINKNISLEWVFMYSRYNHVEQVNNFSSAIGIQIHLVK